MNFVNPFALQEAEYQTQQSYRHQKPQHNDLRKYTAQEFLTWEQQYFPEAGTQTHSVLFFGLPGAGKTSLLGSLVHCIYTQSSLFCRYRDHVTSPQDDQLFYSFVEYFGDAQMTTSIVPTAPNQLFNLSFEFKLEYQEPQILNLVDCSGELYHDFLAISQQQKAPYIPERNADGTLKYQLPRLQQSIFPDYITALLEAPGQIYVYFVCDGDKQRVKNLEFNQDEMFKLIWQELQSFAQVTGKHIHLTVIASKIDLSYPDPFSTTVKIEPVTQVLTEVIRQTMSRLPSQTTYFYSGYLDQEHKQDFVTQQFNPTTKQIVDDLFKKMTGSILSHTSILK